MNPDGYANDEPFPATSLDEILPLSEKTTAASPAKVTAAGPAKAVPAFNSVNSINGVNGVNNH